MHTVIKILQIPKYAKKSVLRKKMPVFPCRALCTEHIHDIPSEQLRTWSTDEHS